LQPIGHLYDDTRRFFCSGVIQGEVSRLEIAKIIQ